jgi:periplasmic divalent cation tolerance protein
MQTEAIVVFITAPTREEAIKLAEMLVNERLAACVQVLPEMLSLYHWEGAIQRDPEHLILCKTMRGRFAELEQAVRAAHSYTTPQIVALPIVAGSELYLGWLLSSLGSQSS